MKSFITFCSFFTFFPLVFSQSVSLDPTFGVGGKVLSNVPSNDYTFRKVELLSNNRLLTLCNPYGDSPFAPLVVSYNYDGTIDSSFANNGVLTLPTIIQKSATIKTVNDDSFFVIGSAEADIVGFYKTIIIKFTNSGTIDLSFGSNGILVAKEYGLSGGSVLEIDSNGKLLVSGKEYNPTAEGDFWVKRFELNGIVDSTFGINGEVVINFDNDDSPTFITFQSNNKIIIAGHTEIPSSQDNSNFVMLRLTIDGLLDASFGNNGKVITDFDGNDIVHCATVLDDDSIILSGTSRFNSDNNSKIAMSKYTSSGILATTFGLNGKMLTQIDSTHQNDGIFNLIERDSKLYGIGFSKNTTFDFLIVRFNSDGTLDTTLNNVGYILTDFNNSADFSFTINSQDEGKLICAGTSTEANNYRPSMARYVFETLSIEEKVVENYILYPNPFSKFIYIKRSVQIEQPTKVEFCDLTGRPIHSNCVIENSELKIELGENLPNGIYFIKISSDQKTETHQLIKQ